MAKQILLDLDSTKYISATTFWEISLKFRLNKLKLKGIFPDQLPKAAFDSGFEVLDLDSNTASSFYKLPELKGKDPFDRMLAWQAMRKNFSLLTKDPDFVYYQKYGLRIVW